MTQNHVNLPPKLLHVRKSTLGVGLIELNTAIDVLALKLHARNKENEATFSKVIAMHEELSVNDGGLNKIE